MCRIEVGMEVKGESIDKVCINKFLCGKHKKFCVGRQEVRYITIKCEVEEPLRKKTCRANKQITWTIIRS